MTDKPKPNRRWLQFSLRTMLILVTVFCIWMGWYTSSSQRQKRAVEAILEAGGTVRYKHEIAPSGVGLPNPSPPGPVWLRKLIGDHFFFYLAKVSFDRVTDSDLAVLEEFRLNHVEHLFILNSNISEDGLAYLNPSNLPKLRRLRLDESRITDDMLIQLMKLKNLENLYLSSTEITDSGLMHLKKLDSLQYLDLNYTQVTDEGKKKFQQALPNCRIAR